MSPEARAARVEVVLGPRRTAVGPLARHRHPEGNLVELVQPVGR